MMISKQTTAMSMMTTPNTTSTNTNANAPVAAADNCDCGKGYTTHADLCTQYIRVTLEEARKERQEEERN
jgi:hypothetical protein